MSQQPQVINTAQIAAMLGVSRRHTTARIVTREDFPRPVLNLSQKTRGWSREAVCKWAQKVTAKENSK